MEKNVSSVAEQDKTAEVKKNPKLIELARPYKFDDKEYTEIDLSGLDDLTIKDAVLIIKKLYNEGEMAVMITPETATAYTDALAAAATKLPIEFFQLLPIGASKKVRQTVQASLRSAAAEEDGDEDEQPIKRAGTMACSVSPIGGTDTMAKSVNSAKKQVITKQIT